MKTQIITPELLDQVRLTTFKDGKPHPRAEEVAKLIHEGFAPHMGKEMTHEEIKAELARVLAPIATVKDGL